MKAENTNDAPEFNMLKPDGVKPQVHSERITHVLLNDGNWYEITRGSFHLYQSAAKAPGFGPYVTFQTTFQSSPHNAPELKTIEVFPASVVGWAF